MSSFKWERINEKTFEILIQGLMRSEYASQESKRGLVVRQYAHTGQPQHGIDIIETYNPAGHVPQAVQCTIRGLNATLATLSSVKSKLAKDLKKFYAEDAFKHLDAHNCPRYNKTHQFVFATLTPSIYKEEMEDYLKGEFDKTANRGQIGPKIWLRGEIEERITRFPDLFHLVDNLTRHNMLFTECKYWTKWANSLGDHYYINFNQCISIEFIEDKIILKWRADGKSSQHKPKLDDQVREDYTFKSIVYEPTESYRNVYSSIDGAPPRGRVSSILQAALLQRTDTPQQHLTVTITYASNHKSEFIIQSNSQGSLNWPDKKQDTQQPSETYKLILEQIDDPTGIIWESPTKLFNKNTSPKKTNIHNLKEEKIKKVKMDACFFFGKVNLNQLFHDISNIQNGISPEIEALALQILEKVENENYYPWRCPNGHFAPYLLLFTSSIYSYANTIGTHDHEPPREVLGGPKIHTLNVALKRYFVARNEHSKETIEADVQHKRAYDHIHKREYLEYWRYKLLENLFICMQIIEAECGDQNFDLATKWKIWQGLSRERPTRPDPAPTSRTLSSCALFRGVLSCPSINWDKFGTQDAWAPSRNEASCSGRPRSGARATPLSHARSPTRRMPRSGFVTWSTRPTRVAWWIGGRRRRTRWVRSCSGIKLRSHQPRSRPTWRP